MINNRRIIWRGERVHGVKAGKVSKNKIPQGTGINDSASTERKEDGETVIKRWD